MTYIESGGFPPQQLPYRKKNKVWRRACVDYGDSYSLLNSSLSMKTVQAMYINYDLVQGKLHMEDLKALVNPFNINASFIPDDIQHYPVINSKIEVLKGEENKRLFDYRVIVTNPNAISEMEETKNTIVNEKLQQLIADTSVDEEEYMRQLDKLSDYFTYEYQDKREVRGNLILNHYVRELEMAQMFNTGFDDKVTVDAELYQCDIVGGEPYVERLDPRDVRIIRRGTSPKVEDADMIVIDQYWNLSRVYDTYYDQLSKKDREYLENELQRDGSYTDSAGNINAAYNNPLTVAGDTMITLFDEDSAYNRSPFDTHGNVRVLRVYWKSRRKLKKVKSYDPETGEEQFNFYPENYIINPDKGEEEETFWVNEAWEGTKIGGEIYINMRPRPIQYSRLSNPSKCHFGIIGNIGGTKSDVPYSLVDIMKPYAYLYDVVHDRLNKLLAKNPGKLIKLDFAKTPNWEVDQWLYYIKTHGIIVEDSFKEGAQGAATGKLAGGLNNASSGVVDASLGNEITQYINYLEWISNKAGDLAGISRQREGQISNRETVGGVERATLQSAHSTEWLFISHESVKKRVLECFLETAKIAFKGRKIKINYVLQDGSRQLFEMDGDEFAECDYGLVVDNSNGAQILNQKLDMLAQAGLQNGMSFSTIMKIYTSNSLAEKQRMVENDERKREEQQQQQQQQQLQLQQQQMQLNAQTAQQQQQLEYQMHVEDNETKILVATINSEAEKLRMAIMNGDNAEANDIEREKIAEQAKEFNAKLALDKQKHQDDVKIKEKQLNKSKK